MAVKGYVLIETQVGKTKEVVEAIRGLAGVASIDAVTGPYDAIAVVEAESASEVDDLILEKVHLIAGISRTVICVAIPL